MKTRYDHKNGYMIHNEKGCYWFGNDGFEGELTGEYTGDEAFVHFTSGATDAHSYFNAVSA